MSPAACFKIFPFSFPRQTEQVNDVELVPISVSNETPHSEWCRDRQGAHDACLQGRIIANASGSNSFQVTWQIGQQSASLTAFSAAEDWKSSTQCLMIDSRGFWVAIFGLFFFFFFFTGFGTMDASTGGKRNPLTFSRKNRKSGYNSSIVSCRNDS